ncbi:MAG TPA: ABC transporter permease [Candidatus Nanopelagicaceae bacterium]|nr:ABC transporter permease [Candidatus Nanopelagicaceae bacterium]
MKSRRWLPYALLIPGILWLAVFFITPMFNLAATSLYDPTGSLDAGYQMTFHFANYSDALSQYYPQFLRSFTYAGIATVCALLIAYPLAYAIALKSGKWKNFLLVLVIAPFFTSFLVRTLAWTAILGDNSTFIHFLRDIHLLSPGGRILATPIAVITGLTYNFLPFMTLPLYASLEKVDPRLIEASSDLYASAFTGFRKVTVPLSMPGVVAGTLLTFIPASGDYINSTLLGQGARTSMVGNIIDSAFLVRLAYPLAAALSFMLMAIIVVLVVIYVRRAGTEELV